MNNGNDELKEKILEAAGKLISKYGISKTTMNDIARACGKGKSTLYHYYGSKEEIALEVINREVVKLFSKMRSAIASTDDPKEQLRVYVLTRVKLLKEVADFYESFREDYFREFGFVEKIRKRYDDEEKRIITGILKAGIDKGAFTMENPEDVANAFVIALKGFEYKWATDIKQRDIFRHVNSLMDVFFKGIEKR
ncbi:TetR/AcrR family transcriptional regulator [candidate division WOR-3 bacterium]|nr:TetR/AcrR family transcriptional regulator [candidate division WOR-3 bacterium]